MVDMGTISSSRGEGMRGGMSGWDGREKVVRR